MHFLSAEFNLTGVTAEPGPDAHAHRSTRDDGYAGSTGQCVLHFGLQFNRLWRCLAALLLEGSLQRGDSDSGRQTDGSTADRADESAHQRLKKICVLESGLLIGSHDPVGDVGVVVVPPTFDLSGASLFALGVGRAVGIVDRHGVMPVSVHFRVVDVAGLPDFFDIVAALGVETDHRPDGGSRYGTCGGTEYGVVSSLVIAGAEIVLSDDLFPNPAGKGASFLSN